MTFLLSMTKHSMATVLFSFKGAPLVFLWASTGFPGLRQEACQATGLLASESVFKGLKHATAFKVSLKEKGKKRVADLCTQECF